MEWSSLLIALVPFSTHRTVGTLMTSSPITAAAGLTAAPSSVVVHVSGIGVWPVGVALVGGLVIPDRDSCGGQTGAVREDR